MFHVVYVSRASRQLVSAELLDLLEVSRRRNGRLLLTGLLLYANGKFMQVLEGREQPVREVYASILADTRHTDINTLRLQETPARHFPDWTMAFGDLDAPEPAVTDDDAKIVAETNIVRSIASHIPATPGLSKFLEPGFKSPTLRDESSDVYQLLRAFRDENTSAENVR
ncbi:MAG: BLUF domain-containing protein [Pseudomonadales bacterium]|nr:BLUF domain-containing protein [Pseudomonadales bacterium]